MVAVNSSLWSGRRGYAGGELPAPKLAGNLALLREPGLRSGAQQAALSARCSVYSWLKSVLD